MRKKGVGVQGAEQVDSYNDLEPLERKRCRVGTKRVGATCSTNAATVTVRLRTVLQDAVSRARHYLQTRHQRVAEVQKAVKAVVEKEAK